MIAPGQVDEADADQHDEPARPIARMLAGMMTMAHEQPQDKWKIEVNDRYQKVIGAIVALATASLVLPALFLREFFAVPKEKALVAFFDFRIYLSWGLLCASILLGIFFYYLSAKWVKSAWVWGQVLTLHVNRGFGVRS